MPKKLLLLLLILLIGGYFFLAPRGSTTREELPSISLKAVVESGENGYVVGVDGSLVLPMEKEYNVNGEVYLTVGGAKIKSSRVSTVSKGPSTIPLSLAGVAVNSGNVAVGVELTVAVDGKEMPFKVELPVTFPPKSSMLQSPVVGISVQSFDVVEGGYDATLKLSFYNPNDFEITVSNVTLKAGESSYPVTVGKISPKDTVVVSVPLTVDSNRVLGEIKGDAVWGSVTKPFRYKFEVGFPQVEPPSPRYSLTFKTKKVSPSGVDIDVNVTVKNPSAIPISLSNLEVKVIKGDITKNVTLAETLNLGPLEEKTFTEEVTAIPFLVGGKLELDVNGEDVLAVPLELVPSDLVRAPELNAYIEDLNGGGSIIHVVLKNINDFNVDVTDFDIEALYNGTDLANYEKTSFVLNDQKEITVGSADSPLALVPGETWIVITYSYGIKDLGLMFREKFSVLYG